LLYLQRRTTAWENKFVVDLDGNVTVSGTVDGVDIAAHAADAAAHHAKTVSSEIDHAEISNVQPDQHHARYTDAEAEAVAKGIVQDTPQDGVTDQPISSNWAYDHKNDVDAHHAKTVSSEIDHGSVQGLGDDDHTQYLHISTPRTMSTELHFTKGYSQFVFIHGGTDRFIWSCNTDSDYPLEIHKQNAGWSRIFRIDASGNIVEVGTVDGVDISAHAADANAHHTPPAVFTDSGDKTAWDFTVGNFTRDGNWHELSLSSLVPAGTKAVLLRLDMAASSPAKVVSFRKHGNSNAYNTSAVQTQVTNVHVQADIVVQVDANRSIDYNVHDTTVDVLNLLVKGYWS